jgi:hypothetical protein
VPRRGVLVFDLATAAIVLHIVDASFLQPEPGVSAGDHLTALIPLAVAVLGAVAYPRLRPGAQACLAILFGTLALAGGAIAVAEGLGAGLEGHDYTGLLLVPAGFALLALASLTLWDSRKGGSRRRRYVRRTLIALAGLFVLYEVVFPVVLSLVVTHRPRTEVVAADLGRAYEDVTLETSDGLRLEGWYVPSENGAAVIAFPGRRGPVNEARMLAAHGYGVLLFDMRGQGESEGDPNMLGWTSPEDLTAAVAFLEARPDVEPGRIGGLGLSVGGEQMIQAAAENDGLAGVVSEGAGIRSIREALLLDGFEKWAGIPVWGITTAATAVFSGAWPPPALDGLAAGISPRALFLAYADPGQGGEQLNPLYFDSAGEPKELWLVPGAGHTGGLDAQPEEYERRVIAFFDEALATSRR